MLIREATPDEERAFFGKNDPAVSGLHCAEIDGKVVAVSGLYRDYNYFGSLFEDGGRQIAFLSVLPDAPLLGWPAVVAMRRFLKSRDDTIVVQQDDEFPQSEKLLRVLGFKRTEKFMADFHTNTRKLRIWEWQPSQ
jgi:esterase/lipase superfamily enzyme